MRPQHLVILLVLPAVLLAALLMLAATAAPAHASGIVSVCDEAHLRAAVAGGGTVTFSCSGTITLTAEIVIVADTTIDGSGQAVTLSGNHAVRVFTVDEGMMLNLNRLTVAHGATVPYDSGGGIHNSGTLIVSNSTFSSNSAGFMASGGGIANDGTLTVSNSTFTDNHASGVPGGSGGGIANGGTLTVSNSTFSGNSAVNTGGGINNGSNSAVTVSNSTFAGNGAEFGGGIFNWGTLTVSNSTFAGNSAADLGGGIANDGTLTVSNTTFAGNSAYQGGGIDNYGTTTVSNSSFSGNSAWTGGGIYNWQDGTVTLKNTIVANSPPGNHCSGAITDGGGNLSTDSTCPGINRDPMLGPLQDNGGSTWTMALGPGSAAIDAADDAICAAPPVNNLDQRGVARPQSLHCDIGAYEAKPPPIFLPIIMR